MRLEKWERLTNWPMMVLSVAFIGDYAVQVLAQPHGFWSTVVGWTMNIIWAIFILDYCAELLLAPHKRAWFKHHLLDLIIVLLPMIRPLRIVMILGALNKLNRQTGLALRGRIALYVCISATILVLVGSLAVFDAERGVAGANIKSFGEALWWAFVTITTVGYGDYSPVSPTGRIIAFALMIAGIALIGVVTAMLASWIVERVGAQENKDLQITREQVERLSGQLAHIEIELKKLETSQKPHNISASGRSDLKPFGK